MSKSKSVLIRGAIFALAFSPGISAAQTISASSLAFRSTGAQSGSEITLSNDGYLGTYVTLAAPGQVQLSIQARGQSDAGIAPRLGVVVNDSKQFFNVSSTNTSYGQTLDLPAGTHFVRLQYDNDNGSASRSLTLRDLSITGATLNNVGSNANALAAADTYIANYRRGAANVAVTGPSGIPLLPGTSLQVGLQKHAFAFGTAVPGTSATGVNNYLGNGGTARQQQYQARLLQNFNALVPENAGKWAYNEATRDVNTMTGVDAILNYAQTNGMRSRAHNLIWGDNSNNGQQPGWVLNNNAAPNNGLLDKAFLGDTAARDDLRTEISERIDYYVGTGTPTDRAKRYYEIDVYNESYHTGPGAPSSLRANYWNVYGPAGIADIYRETIQAIQSSGATAKVFVNEYNVLDDNSYANYYMDNLQAIRLAGLAAGHGEVVQGIGAQYYPSLNTHNAHKAMTNFQNFGVRGLPITLTEFGAQSSLTTTQATTILGEMLRLSFGNADTSGFYMWGFHQESGTGATTLFAPQAALYTVNTSNFNSWTLTDAGRLWQDQLGIADWDGNVNNGWTTNLAATVDAAGMISFNGFFGTYQLGGVNGALVLEKGQQNYAVQLAAPPGWSLWNVASDGAFSLAGNWSAGVPAGTVATAHFGSAPAARLVNIASEVALGQVNLVGSNGYRLTGAGALRLEGPAGIAAIYVADGEHHIEVPVTAHSTLRIGALGASRLVLSSNLDLNENDLVKFGPGTVRLGRIDAGDIDVQAGRIESTSQISTAKSLSIAANAALDVTGTSSWIIDYDGASPLADLRTLLTTGRNGGDWDGDGITSSAAAADARFAVAMAEASDLGVTTFPGSNTPVDATSVLFRVTLTGDASMDGIVNLSDFSLVAANFNGTNLAWHDGDFTYDEVVNLADFALLASHFNQEFTAAARDARSVPEPGCVAMFGAAATILTRRRRDFSLTLWSSRYNK